MAKLFGDWSSACAKVRRNKASVIVPDAPSVTTRQLVSVPMMNKSQADVAYGFIGIRRSNPDYTAMSVMNNALGQYAIGGRLGDSIRERQGMAYYVFSSLDARLGPGPLLIRAGVSAENVETDDRLDRRRVHGGLERGLHRAGDRRIEELLIGVDAAAARDQRGHRGIPADGRDFGLGLDYDERLPGLIGAVTKDAADAAARRLLDPARATIAVAGPWTPPSTSRGPRARRTALKAVFFDVDFTLIYPGPTFRARDTSAPAPRTASRSIRRGSTSGGRVVVHPRRSRGADLHARRLHPLHRVDHREDGRPRRRTSSKWRARSTTSGRSTTISRCTTTWRRCSTRWQQRGLIVGVISNSHRSLDAFREHFSLDDMISVVGVGAEHGYMKPHPSIFEKALERAGVEAARR